MASRRWWFWLVALLALLPGWGAQAAPWQRDPLLSQLLIKDLTVDRSGFQWVATNEGIYRYDGYELVPLKQLAKPSGLTDGRFCVNSLVFDRAGRLWIGSSKGVLRFQPQSGELQRVSLPSASTNEHHLLLHPQTGMLWVGYGSAIVLIDPERPAQARVVQPDIGGGPIYLQPAGAGVWVSLLQPNWPVPRVYANVDPPGAVLLAADGQVRRRLTTNSFMVPVPGTAPLRLFSASAAFVADAAGRLRETARWLPAGKEDVFVPLGTGPDSAREWVTQGHRVRLVVRGASAGAVTCDTVALGSAPVDHRHSYVLTQDPLGFRWCYSLFWRGCYKQPAAHAQIMQPMRLPTGRPTPSCRAIARLPDGRLLLGAYGGLLVQAADSPNAAFRPWPITQNGVPRRPLGYDLLVTRTGRVLVSEDMLVLTELNPTRGEVYPLPLAQVPAPLHTYALAEDATGHIWVGTSAGLYEVRPTDHRVARYARGAAGQRLAALEVLDLAPEPGTNRLWLATTEGVYLLTPATGELRRVGPATSVLCVASAGAGRAWAGTAAEGLYHLDARRGLLRRLGLADGLPSQTVATVLVRPGGVVWAGTFAGVVRYDPATQHLAVLTEADGLTDAEMNHSSVYLDPLTGGLWFGGVGGLHRVQADPAEQGSPTRAALLVTGVTEASAADLGLVNRPLHGPQQPVLHLAADPGAFVEVRLAFSNLLTPDLTHYAYRLLRPDGRALTQWLPTTRRLVLRDLAAGDYLVEARAESVTGQPAANTVRLPLHVARVWWQHPLAWLAGAGLLVALSYLLFWLQGLPARREARMREELAANLHDEVGALLTRISFQAQLLRDQHRQPVPTDPDAGVGLDRLLHNSRMAVQTMRDVVWSIDASADSVGALFDRMRDQLDQLSASTGLAMPLHTAGLPDTLVLPRLLRQQLYLIFKEALTNAVRHATGATTIAVRLTRADGVITLEVVDDGAYRAPARPPARPPSGLGLRNMAHRAKSIGGELTTGARPDGQRGYRVQVVVRGW